MDALWARQPYGGSLRPAAPCVTLKSRQLSSRRRLLQLQNSGSMGLPSSEACLPMTLTTKLHLIYHKHPWSSEGGSQ